ncbi:MAG TPA: SGNH/GDSL hydrolase family protein [Arsenicitalea sp.]|jgi:lysophospholipase L1-like esterase|nr:SGNH/GDSL hydrolase family protein [Arsenicitalea sp.]
MKTILAYGDSLTFGSNPIAQSRHLYEDRWPTVLEAGLGGKARVIPEGLGGRTTAFDDFSALADRNGVRILPTILGSHSPLDLVVIMLGTNDLKPFINGSALGAAHGVKRLVEVIRTYPYNAGISVPKIVVVAPPHLVETEHADLKYMFLDGVAESAKLAGHYARISRDLGVAFFDAGTVAVANAIDGVHLDAANTRAIGTGLVPVVKELLQL